MDTWIETRDALLEVLKTLSDEFPPSNSISGADRNLMHDYIRQRNWHSARMAAIWSGIPKDRIDNIASLLG